MIEELIGDLSTLGQISGYFNCKNHESRLKLLEYFGNENEVEIYLAKARSKASKLGCSKRKRTKNPNSVNFINRLKRIISEEQYKTYEDYITYVAERLNSLWQKGLPQKIQGFVADQLTYYEKTDDLISGWLYYESLEKFYNPMDINYWIARYGNKIGIKRFNNRKAACNIHNTLSPFEVEEYRKTISKAVRKWRSEETYEERQEKQIVCIPYWLKRGYTEEEAKIEISKFQSKSAQSFYAKLRAKGEKFLNNTTLEFYLERGYSEEDAIIARSERQRTFTLEKCIDRHGEEEGYTIWKDRQERWQNTLNSKSQEEIDAINFKKYYGRKFQASKSSLKLFNPLIEQIIIENILTIDEIYIGLHENKKEYWINYGSGIYFYDFTIPKFNYIVEFHGLPFHYDEITDSIPNNYYNFDKESIKIKDKHKFNVAVDKGFDVDIVWENPKGYKDELNRIMDRIRSFNRVYKGNVKGS